MEILDLEVTDEEWKRLLFNGSTEIIRPANEKTKKEFSQVFRMYPNSKVPIGTDEHDIIFKRKDAGKNEKARGYAAAVDAIRRTCVLTMRGSDYVLQKSTVKVQA